MAVIHCKEVPNRSGSDDLDTNHRHTRTFQVLTDDVNDGARIVLDHTELPDYGDVYETFVWDPIVEAFTTLIERDENSVVVSRRAENNDADNPNNWTATVEYAGVDDPVSQPADVEFTTVPYQEAMIDDEDGNPVTNSADDPFETGVMRDRTRLKLVIEVNVLDEDWDPIEAEKYLDSTNDELFLAGYFVNNPGGYDLGTCKLSGLTAKRVKRSGNESFYWRRRAEIDIDSKGWDAKVRDAGFRELDPVLLTPRDIFTGPGTKPSSPVLLNGDGLKLGVNPGPPITPGTPVVLTFKRYERKDWTPLNLEY